jgi:RNA polymerase sigma-70 factor (ECF subfamily)
MEALVVSRVVTPPRTGDLVLPFRRDAGRREAFAHLVAVHEQRVLRMAYRIVGSLADAQDISQEVFVRLLKHLDEIDGDPQWWLYRVTVNMCHDHFKRRSPAEPAEGDWPDPAPGPHCVLELDERKQLLAEAVAQLPERERMAVVLRDIEGLPTREVARIMDVEEVTVRSQTAAARMKLTKYVRARR